MGRVANGLRRRAAACVALGLVLAAGACELDTTAAPVGVERPVVHAVLNPAASEVVILVERSLTGSTTVDEDVIFDPRDPIVTGNGVPITGAVVEVSGAGRTARAVEDVAGGSDGRGRGVYRVRNSRNAGTQNLELLPGERYSLRITSGGRLIATATALIPDVRPATPSSVPQPFRRDLDTLKLRWEAAAGAKRYALRVDTPFGPFYLFTDATSFDLAGGLRNFFAEGLPHVFIPGFDQSVQVAAVDTNFVDYYRTANDPFTGTGLITRIEGGIGVFGAYVPLDTRVLDVRAEAGSPPAGRYEGLDTFPADALQLYVESSAGGRTQLSGRLETPAGERFGVLGLLRGEELTLSALAAQNVADTQFVFRGRLAGDSIRGEWERRGSGFQPLSSSYRRR